MRAFFVLIMLVGVSFGEKALVDYAAPRALAEQFMFHKFLGSEVIMAVELSKDGSFRARRNLLGKMPREEFLKVYEKFLKSKGFRLDKVGRPELVKGDLGGATFYLFVKPGGKAAWFFNGAGFLYEWHNGRWEQVWYEKTAQEMEEDLKSLGAIEKLGIFKELDAGTFAESEVKLSAEWVRFLYAAGKTTWMRQLVDYAVKNKVGQGSELLDLAWRLGGSDFKRYWTAAEFERVGALVDLFEAYGDEKVILLAREKALGVFMSEGVGVEGRFEMEKFLGAFALKDFKFGEQGLSSGGVRRVLELAILLNDERVMDVVFGMIGERGNVADLPLVGWFLATDYCVKGGVDELTRVFVCLEKRKEREVVWLVSGLLEHGDKGVSKLAREFLVKRVGKDLGGEVKGWRDWVRAE